MYVFDFWLSNLNYNHRNTTIPNEVEDVYDQEGYHKWLEYYMTNFRFSRITKTMDTLLFLVLLIFGVFPLFESISKNIVDQKALQATIFLGLYYILNVLIGIYPSYYQKFVIEEKFGFNKSTKQTFVVDQIKSILLTSILVGSLIYGIATIYYSAGSMFFVYAYVTIVVVMLLINMLYVKLFVPIFNKLQPLEDSTLKTKIEEFAKSVGYQVSKISVIDASKRSTKLNAFFSGFGKTKQIVLYDTLIEKMSEEEVVAVLAHEIGHNKHKHIIWNLLNSFIMMSLYLLVFWFVLESEVFSKAFGFETTNFGFSLIVFSVLLSPLQIIIGMLQSQLSMKFEYQADRFAASKYSKEHMETALKVLAKENFTNLTPHPLYVTLTYSHPPIAQRIKAIRKV